MEASTSPSNGGKASVGDGGGGLPRPAPLPKANTPPPFLVKTYDMVDDPSTDKIVSWSPTNNSFVIWDSAEFAKSLLPKYFKHNNLSSFVRQLNTYGFRKVDPDRWEFANEGFLRGKKHLLRGISRRKSAHGHHQPQQLSHGQSTSVGACVEVGKFGLEEEVERLKRDKNVLMQELVRLRQQQQTTDNQLQSMVHRLQGMEQRQQQMMSFLAKAMNSPGFLAQFMQQQNDGNRRISNLNKKRRLTQDGIANDDSVGPLDGQIVKYEPLMNEAAKAMLRRIVKINSSSRLENYNSNPDSFLIGDASSLSNALDTDNSLNHVSGVTLQEVPPTSGPSFISSDSTITGLSSSGAISEIPSSSSPLGATSELATNQFLDVSQLIGAQEYPVTLPTTDAIMPEFSDILPETNVDIVGSARESGASMDPISVAECDKISSELGGTFPNPQMEWDNTLMDDIQELPGMSDPFWERFLQSPSILEMEEMDSTLTDEIPKENENKQFENRWDKSQNMQELTEQMGLLSSDPRKV